MISALIIIALLAALVQFHDDGFRFAHAQQLIWRYEGFDMIAHGFFILLGLTMLKSIQ